MNLMDKVAKQQLIERASFDVGDTVSVHTKIIEGETERVQVFKGNVISIKGTGISKSFTVRRVSFGSGVERVFPVNSPRIVKIEVERKSKVRRSKLYYLRDKAGKAARLKEKSRN